MMTRRSAALAHHGHARSQCLQVLRSLSTYLDQELSTSICKEIRKHLGACPNCEEFVHSLRQTIRLCRHVPPPPLSPALKAQLRTRILKAAGRA